jgi:hypothetical protein
MKRERNLTAEEMNKLLDWLDLDREKAGTKLKEIEARLSRIFISRGCVADDVLKDEVINRVAVRIDKARENYPDLLRCCLGFVENVYREYLREQKNIASLSVAPPQPRPAEELEKEDKCLRECMGKLTAEEQGVLVNYFQGEKGDRIAKRKRLAKELGLSNIAMRCQAHRVRKKARLCLQSCLEKT